MDHKVDLSEAPMRPEEVTERLNALHEFDEKIIELLETASASIQALKQGKSSSATPASSANTNAKHEFQQTTGEYFALLEQISVGLRNEVRLLHNQSSEKVLPLSLTGKAYWIGQQKENEVWQKIDGLLDNDSQAASEPAPDSTSDNENEKMEE